MAGERKGGRAGEERLPLLLAAGWHGGSEPGAPSAAGGCPSPSLPVSECATCRSTIAAAAGDGEVQPRKAANALDVAAAPAGSGGMLHPAGCPWGVTSTLLLADMFGIGSLALPGAFARLGWLLSLSFLMLFAVGCGFLGVLFTKLAVAVPQATAFDELGSAALGRAGKVMVYICVYTTIVADPVVLQLTCVLALQQIIPSLSSLAAGLVVFAIMTPLAQIRNVHDVGSLSIMATACMAFATLVCLIKLLAMPGSAFEQTSLLPPPETTFSAALVSMMSLCFAFGGQVNWLRYISAMRHRDEFHWAAELADAFMLSFYVLLATVSYFKLGTSFDTSKPITSVLPRDSWTVLMNVALLFRCTVAYILNINVFTDLFTRLGKPWLARAEAAAGEQAGPRVSWAAVSLCGLLMSFMVAWVVPFFSTILAFIAAFGDVLAPYTLPCLFALVLLPELPRWERGLLRMLVPVSVMFAVFGLVAAAMDLVGRLAQRQDR